MDSPIDTRKTRPVWMMLAALLIMPLGAGFVSAGHDGAPGGGALDGWVDAHGDTMYGPLSTYSDIEFREATGGSRALAMDEDGLLRFDGGRVCVGELTIPGCGKITKVQSGFGISTSTDGWGVASVHVSPSSVQTRIRDDCGVDQFIHSVSIYGVPECGTPRGYTDEDAVMAVSAAGFTKPEDLAPVATTGSALDLTDLSLGALAGSPCTFEGLDGLVTISFTSRGEIGLVCDADIDFDTDPAHCGGANQPVPEWPNANVACVVGAPVIVSCVDGFYDLDGELSNGCESDTVCEPPLTLVNGQCVDLATDPNNCGEPGNVVPDAPNAETGCVDGTYAILSCHAGYADMDGVFDNGCETAADTWYIDNDGDGYGWHETWVMDFSQPQGYVWNDFDCDDSSMDISPDAPEVVGDGIDNDCDGVLE